VITAEVAAVRSVGVAVSVWLPAMSIFRSVKVATPLTAAVVVDPFNAPVPVAFVMTTLTVLAVFVVPAASCIATTGCVVNATVAAAPPGCVVKAHFVAVPATVMFESAAVRSVGVAVSVWAPAVSIFRSVKVATPLTAAFVVVPDNAPAPVFFDMTTVTVLTVFVVPVESCIATTGCVGNATVATAPPGCVVKAHFVAVPKVTVIKLEFAAVRPAGVAVSVWTPAVSIFNSVKVATPLTAALVVPPVPVPPPDNTPAPPPALIVMTTLRVLSVFVVPVASCTATTGCVPNATPATIAPPGCVVKAPLLAGPKVTVIEFESAALRPAGVAVSTKSPLVSIFRSVKVATPWTAACVVVPDNAPVPMAFVMTTLTVLAVFVVPAASCIVTTGCVVNATVAAAPPGCVVKAHFVAVPATVNEFEVAGVRSVGVAVSVWSPAMSIFRSVNDATPLTAAFVVVPDNAPVPVAFVMTTLRVLTVFVMPAASCIATTGCVANTPPAAAPPGCVVKAHFVASPATVNEFEIVAVRPSGVAVSSWAPLVSIFRSVKVATPLTAAFVVVPDNAPVPVLFDMTTLTVLSVFVVPVASCTATTGCVGNATVATAPPGCVVKAPLLAAPKVMVIEFESAAVRPAGVAVSTKSPAVSIFRSTKVATPLTAAFVVVPDNVPVPVFFDMTTLRVLSVFVVPVASCIATTGCVANATPAAIAPPGCVVKAPLLAAPKVMVIESESAAVRPAGVAVSTKSPAVSIFRSAKVATPLTAAFVVVPDNVPVPVFFDMTTLRVLSVTAVPVISCIATTGCVPNATPAAIAPPGCVVKAPLLAAPKVMVIESESAAVRPAGVAVSTWAPAVSIFRPTKVATPEAAAFVVVPDNAPVPVFFDMTTLRVLSVFVVPVASCIATTGCVANATPAAIAPPGCVVKAPLLAAPKVMVIEVEVAAVRPVGVAASSWAPAVSIFRSVKVATPLTAAFVVVPDNAPVPVLFDMTTLTVLSVFVVPVASCTATTGCVGNATVATAPPGCVVKAPLLAAPKVMVIESESAAVRPAGVAVSTKSPAVSIFRSAKVATPLTAAFVVVPDNVPVPVFFDMTTLTVLSATFWSVSSRISTTGCVANATPAAIAPPGCVVKAHFVAVPSQPDSCDATNSNATA